MKTNKSLKVRYHDRLVGILALTRENRIAFEYADEWLELEVLARECRNILESKESNELDLLYHLGGTSGGARPKIMTEMEGKPWIIKFPAHVDRRDAGKMEFDYSLCAKRCGIQLCGGYAWSVSLRLAEDHPTAQGVS